MALRRAFDKLTPEAMGWNPIMGFEDSMHGWMKPDGTIAYEVPDTYTAIEWDDADPTRVRKASADANQNITGAWSPWSQPVARGGDGGFFSETFGPTIQSAGEFATSPEMAMFLAATGGANYAMTGSPFQAAGAVGDPWYMAAEAGAGAGGDLSYGVTDAGGGMDEFSWLSDNPSNGWFNDGLSNNLGYDTSGTTFGYGSEGGFAGSGWLGGSEAGWAMPGVGAIGTEGLIGSGLSVTQGLTLANLVKSLTGRDATSADISRLVGGLGAAGLGAYGANQTAGALERIASGQNAAQQSRFDTLVGLDRERYNTSLQRENEAIAKRDGLIAEAKAIGAPSRARYEGSYAPGFTMANEPGYRDALDQTTKSTLHSLSVTGNPASSPNAWLQTLEDVNSKLALPALNNYRNTNATTGGYSSFGAAGATIPGTSSGVPTGQTAGSNIGTSAGSDAAMNGILANRGIYDAIGSGIADLTTERTSLEQLLKRMGGNNIFEVM